MIAAVRNLSATIMIHTVIGVIEYARIMYVEKFSAIQKSFCSHRNSFR